MPPGDPHAAEERGADPVDEDGVENRRQIEPLKASERLDHQGLEAPGHEPARRERDRRRDQGGTEDVVGHPLAESGREQQADADGADHAVGEDRPDRRSGPPRIARSDGGRHEPDDREVEPELTDAASDHHDAQDREVRAQLRRGQEPRQDGIERQRQDARCNLPGEDPGRPLQESIAQARAPWSRPAPIDGIVKQPQVRALLDLVRHPTVPRRVRARRAASRGRTPRRSSRTWPFPPGWD